MVIQSLLLTTVQPQLPETVMLSVPVLPEAGTTGELGETVMVQSPASWLTVNVWIPPTVTVPVRGCPVVFAATLYPKLPLPAPELPEVMVIQLTVLTAERSQLEELAVTVTLPVPPVTATVTPPGNRVRLHAAD
jgi:hypothetical protein